MPFKTWTKLPEFVCDGETTTELREGATEPAQLGDIVCHDNQSEGNSEMTENTSEKQRNTALVPSGTRGESRIRLRWEDRLEQLAQFRAKYGHVDVPRSYVKDPSLATFVCNQRQSYKRMIEGKGPSMDQGRIQQLNSLQFKWILRHKDQPTVVEDSVLCDSKKTVTDGQTAIDLITSENIVGGNTAQAFPRRARTMDWQEGIATLKEFQVQNGHLNVPHIFPANQPLGNFVKSIRQHYKQMQNGKASKFLKAERITELQNMGFKLIVRARAPWNERIEELKQYVKAHGNCEVPKHSPLGIWILNQRSQYKLMMKNQPSHMTEDRILQLNAAGFDWKIHARQVSYPLYSAPVASGGNGDDIAEQTNTEFRPPSLPPVEEMPKIDMLGSLPQLVTDIVTDSSDEDASGHHMDGSFLENGYTTNNNSPSDFVQDLLMERI